MCNVNFFNFAYNYLFKNRASKLKVFEYDVWWTIQNMVIRNRTLVYFLLKIWGKIKLIWKRTLWNGKYGIKNKKTF